MSESPAGSEREGAKSRKPGLPWWATATAGVVLAALGVFVAVVLLRSGVIGSRSTPDALAPPAAVDPTTSSTTTTTATSTTVPLLPVPIEGLEAEFPEPETVVFQWQDASGEDRYLITYLTDGPPISDTLGADTSVWEAPSTCGTRLELTLEAVDAHGHPIATGTLEADSPACPHGPSALRLEGFTHDGLARLSWSPAAGHLAYWWELTWESRDGPKAGAAEGGVPARRESLELSVPCNSDFEFMLSAVDDDTAIIGSVAGEYTSADCASVILYLPPTAASGVEAVGSPNGPPAQSIASCPDGAAAIGGGFVAAPEVGEVERGFVVASLQASPSEWAARIQSPASRLVTIRAHAICLPDAETQTVVTRADVESGATVTLTAGCPAGSVAISGGWETAAGLNVLASIPESGGWSIRVADELADGTPRTAAVQAVCLLDDRPSTVVVSSADSIPYNGAATLPAPRCPDGTYPTGVGVSSDRSVVFESLEWADTGWTVEVRNPWRFAASGPAARVRLLGVCLDVSG